MRRYSIRSLMVFVLISAVAVAALRSADDYWASGMILATPMLFGVALIGALCGGERSRPRRLGFAILGGGYFALAFMGLPRQNAERLPTSQLLTYIHQQVAPTLAGTIAFTTLTTVAGQAPPPALNAQPTTMYVVTSPPAARGPSTVVVTTGRWKSLLPGAANLEAFSIVGHCLFALLAGLVGGIVAVRLHSRRERGRSDPEALPRPSQQSALGAGGGG